MCSISSISSGGRGGMTKADVIFAHVGVVLSFCRSENPWPVFSVQTKHVSLVFLVSAE